MIKPKLTFFQMKIKSLSLYAPEAYQTSFGISPKTLYAIDMAIFIGKFIVTMVDSIMFLVTEIYQTVIPSPTVRMNNTFGIHAATDDALQSDLGAIRDNLCINLPLPFEESKNYCFSSSATTSEPSDSASAKVTFINLNLAGNRRFYFTGKGNSLSYPL